MVMGEGRCVPVRGASFFPLSRNQKEQGNCRGPREGFFNKANGVVEAFSVGNCRGPRERCFKEVIKVNDDTQSVIVAVPVRGVSQPALFLAGEQIKEIVAVPVRGVSAK